VASSQEQTSLDFGLTGSKGSLIAHRAHRESSLIDAGFSTREACSTPPPGSRVGAKISKEQIRDIAALLEFALFRKDEREEKKNFVSYVMGRALQSVTELSGIEAKSFLDRFGSYQGTVYTPHPEGVHRAVERWKVHESRRKEKVG
jgi:hypothetical protein